MTEPSFKGVLRSTTVMFLFVGLVGIWMGSVDAVPALIQALQDQDEDAEVREWAANALGQIGSVDVVPALILQ